MTCKLAVVNFLKNKKPAQTKVEMKKSTIPSYDPEEDLLYDFTDDNVNEEDPMDLDDLDDVKLEVE